MLGDPHLSASLEDLGATAGLSQGEGYLLRCAPGLLHGMTLHPLGDHPAKLAFRLDQFSG